MVEEWTILVQPAVSEDKQYTNLEEHEDGQINMMNTDHIIFNAKGSSIPTKIKTSSFLQQYKQQVQ